MSATVTLSAQSGACIFAHESGAAGLSELDVRLLDALQAAGFALVFCSASEALAGAERVALEARCLHVLTGMTGRGRFSLFRAGLLALGAAAHEAGTLLFTHDGLYGPLGPLDDLLGLGQASGLDVWGATEGYNGQYHLHSDFWLMRSGALALPAVQAFWNSLPEPGTGADVSEPESAHQAHQALTRLEVAACNAWGDALLRVGALCSVWTVSRELTEAVQQGLSGQPLLCQQVLGQLGPLAQLGRGSDMRHAHWALLVQRHGLPFILKEVLRSNPQGADIAHWFPLLSQKNPAAAQAIAADLSQQQGADASHTFAWMLEGAATPSGITLPYFLTQLLTTWPDLEHKLGIGIDSEMAVLNAIAYWEHSQRHNLADIQWPLDNRFPTEIGQSAPEVEQDAVLPITRGALAAWRTRSELQVMDLGTYLGRQQFMYWQLTVGQQEYRFLALSEAQKHHLMAPCQRFGGRIAHLPNLVLLLAAFHAGTPAFVSELQAGDVAAYERWWPWKRDDLLALVQALVTLPEHSPQAFRAGVPCGTRLASGVNVVGMPNGQFGVGEDARTATRALLRAGIAAHVCPAPIGALTTVFKPEWTDPLVCSTPRSRTNLICLPAADTYQLLLKGWAPVLAGRYNICAWQWELPRWPAKWHKLLNIPDEIWAQSRFVAQMFAAATDKPVTYMPLSVEKPVFTARGKAYFGIPEQAFTFLSVFDCNSWIKRKNPMAAVKAFAAAFPAGRSDVRLVVKIMNSQDSIAEYRELLAAVATDPRIILIDRFLPRNDMLALIDACDVFVSLHRSEGFGRVIAEAMFMGKAVISTNYSGSVDFAFEGTAYVVNGPLVSLEHGDYVDHEGQQWMEPDLGEAAQAYRQCVENTQTTQALALAGQRQIAQHHTIAQIARLYRERLGQLGVTCSPGQTP